MEQVLALYKPIAEKLFIQIGKTTPRKDRRQIIKIAICKAVKEYTPGFGDFEKFITKRTNESLKLKNIHYVKHNINKSMDAALTDDSSFNLYSLTSFIDSSYVLAENRITEEQFEQQLSKNDSDVLPL